MYVVLSGYNFSGCSDYLERRYMVVRFSAYEALAVTNEWNFPRTSQIASWVVEMAQLHTTQTNSIIGRNCKRRVTRLPLVAVCSFESASRLYP